MYINPNHSNTLLPPFVPCYLSMHAAHACSPIRAKLPLPAPHFTLCISLDKDPQTLRASLSDANGSFSAGCLWRCCCRESDFISGIIIDNAFYTALWFLLFLFIYCCCRILLSVAFLLHFLHKENRKQLRLRPCVRNQWTGQRVSLSVCDHPALL